jgi:hypothetical protein
MDILQQQQQLENLKNRANDANDVVHNADQSVPERTEYHEGIQNEVQRGIDLQNHGPQRIEHDLRCLQPVIANQITNFTERVTNQTQQRAANGRKGIDCRG